MDTGPIFACSSCGSVVGDPEARTCSACLAPLKTRVFGARVPLEGFQADRRAHGADPRIERRPAQRGLAAALSFSALFLFVGAGATIAMSVASGFDPGTLSLLVGALVPLGMAVALLEMARRVGRSGP